MKNYEPRICVICGKTFIPFRSDQKTCGEPECVKLNRQSAARDYRRRNYRKTLENNRRCMERKRKNYKPKPDTIVAIGYADRQKAETLRMAGKVEPHL